MISCCSARPALPCRAGILSPHAQRHRQLNTSPATQLVSAPAAGPLLPLHGSGASHQLHGPRPPGPHIPWRPGRSDKPDGTHCPPDGRLPDGDKGAAHIRDIFYRMGFNDQVGGAACVLACMLAWPLTGAWLRLGASLVPACLATRWPPWAGPPTSIPAAAILWLLGSES
jgi:hypothetical protein